MNTAVLELDQFLYCSIEVKLLLHMIGGNITLSLCIMIYREFIPAGAIPLEVNDVIQAP